MTEPTRSADPAADELLEQRTTAFVAAIAAVGAIYAAAAAPSPDEEHS